jgi:mitochondrial cardiolipin hydrolase
MEQKRKLWVLPICVALGMARASGETRAFFSSRDSVEQEICRLIDRSGDSIDMALFEFRSPRLAQALARARAKGVFLRIILDAGYGARRSGGIIKEMLFRPDEVRYLGGKWSRGRGAMHHKFAIFDQKRVVTGSFNWTPGAEHVNYENVLLMDESEPVMAYEREFDALWRRSSLRTAHGPAPRPPNPRIHDGARGHRRKKLMQLSPSKSARI